MLTIGKFADPIKSKRCGTIIYTLEQNKTSWSLWFLLARDKKTGELGDLGGGIKKNENTLAAGFRELKEESRGIFSEVYRRPQDMANCVAVIDDKADMTELFAPVHQDWLYMASEKFKYTPPMKKNIDEMSELVWVSQDTLNDLVWGQSLLDVGSMWSKIKIFLQRSVKSRDKFFKYLKNYAILSSVSQN